jgi:hypothetical protein
LFAIIAAAALAANEVSIVGAPAGAAADLDPAEAAGFFAADDAVDEAGADADADAAGFFAGVAAFSLEPVSLFFLAMVCNSFRVAAR